ncbi:MAG: hypothetical protein Q8J97_13115 [Flavobacteriaceae bacterium]|nr:hypothetical protein [Flavobacteriaceae bacterium]
MTTELYSFILTLAGVAISLLLAVIGYFLKKNADATDKYVLVTENLTKAVNSLNITVQLLENSQANLVSNSSMQHEIIDKRLNAHSEKINEHSEEIATLKAIKSRTLKQTAKDTAPNRRKS